MKWINFSDRLPPNIEWVQCRTKEGATPYVEISCRVMESKVPFSVYDILNRVEVNVKEYFVTTGYRQGRITQGYTLNELEWLDEYSPSKTDIVNTWFTLVLLPFLSLKGVRLDDELRAIWKQLTKSLEQ